MPKAELHFELPEDKDEHYCALNGSAYRAVVSNLDLWLRKMAKYEDIDVVKISDVREKITELLNDYDLNE